MWGSNKQVLHAKITNIISCTSRYYEEEKNWDDWDDWFNLLPLIKKSGIIGDFGENITIN